MIKEFLRKSLPFMGYSAFYSFAFMLSVYLMFPYERIRDKVVIEFAKQQRGPNPMTLDIEEMSPYWFTGVQATNVALTIPPKESFGREGESEKAPTVITLEELKVRLSIFKRIIGKTEVSISISAFGGEINGVFHDDGTERSIELDLENINVGQMTILSSLVGLPIAGTLHGTVNLTMPDRRIAKSNGSIALTVDGLAVGDGKTKIKNTLALPRMNVGEFAFEAEVTNGVMRLSKLGASGQDLDIAADGKFTLRDSLSESISDLYLRFKFNDSYRKKNDITKGLFGEPGSSTPGLFEIADPKIKQSKRADGFYGWHMVGMVSAPRFDPFAGTVPSSATSSKKTKDKDKDKDKEKDKELG